MSKAHPAVNVQKVMGRQKIRALRKSSVTATDARMSAEALAFLMSTLERMETQVLHLDARLDKMAAQGVFHHVLQQEDERRIEAEMCPVPEFDLEAVDWQIAQNIKVRDEFVRLSAGLLNAEQVAAVLGSAAKNRSAMASRLKEAGKVLVVRYGQRDLFPLFQFDIVNQRPYTEMEQILTILAEGYDSGWQRALWFITENDWLNGKKPISIWPRQRQAVVNAAESEKAMFDD